MTNVGILSSEVAVLNSNLLEKYKSSNRVGIKTFQNIVPVFIFYYLIKKALFTLTCIFTVDGLRCTDFRVLNKHKFMPHKSSMSILMTGCAIEPP